MFGKCLWMGVAWTDLTFTPEMCLATLTDDSIKSYRGKVMTFFKFCRKNGISDHFLSSSVELYIFDQWRRNLKKSSPEGFRSAFRKFCIIDGKLDPFSPKIDLMIDAFGSDYPELLRKFICVGDLAKLVCAAVKESKADYRDLIELIFFSVWQNVRIGTLC